HVQRPRLRARPSEARPGGRPDAGRRPRRSQLFELPPGLLRRLRRGLRLLGSRLRGGLPGPLEGLRGRVREAGHALGVNGQGTGTPWLARARTAQAFTTEKTKAGTL